jgi:hypothetical protein
VKKSDKIIIIFYIFLAFSYVSFLLISGDGIENNPFQSITPKKLTDFSTNQSITVNSKTLFDAMSNIENFPNIIPQNIISVNILNKTDSIIFAEEEFIESNIRSKLLVKHTIKPYSEHIIEILDGDAKGTVITQSFEEINSQTILNTQVHLEVKGILSIISYFPESNLVHAINTVNSNFIEYVQRDKYEKKVDQIYLEILNRTSDKEGLTHFSELLRNDQISEDEIRSILLSSNERLLLTSKSDNELSVETKEVINDLYNKILLRDADPVGMAHFGKLLETGKTPNEIRTLLIESEEGKHIFIFHPVRGEIKILYRELFDRPATDYELDYYHKMIDNNTMTIDDIRTELKKSEEHTNQKN